MTDEYTLPEVGRRLAAARLHRSLSQGTVARMAGLQPSYLSRIENGRVRPRFATVLRIQRALRASFEEIAGPDQPGNHGACPVSSSGRCMLELVQPLSESGRRSKSESYTPREIRLLRRVATWIKQVPADRVRALEILVTELTRGRPRPRPRG